MKLNGPCRITPNIEIVPVPDYESFHQEIESRFSPAYFLESGKCPEMRPSDILLISCMEVAKIVYEISTFEERTKSIESIEEVISFQIDLMKKSFFQAFIAPPSAVALYQDNDSANEKAVNANFRNPTRMFMNATLLHSWDFPCEVILSFPGVDGVSDSYAPPQLPAARYGAREDKKLISHEVLRKTYERLRGIGGLTENRFKLALEVLYRSRTISNTEFVIVNFATILEILLKRNKKENRRNMRERIYRIFGSKEYVELIDNIYCLRNVSVHEGYLSSSILCSRLGGRDASSSLIIAEEFLLNLVRQLLERGHLPFDADTLHS